MAKNFVQPGREITFTAPYQRNSGQAALLGSVVGIALQTVANAVAGEWSLEGVWDVDKVSAQAWTAGALIYWDDSAKLFTNVSTSNTRAGFAVLAASNPSSTGRVRLNGNAAPTGA
jgi:predicted RecA/RadA family phage recombinase